MKKIMLFLLAAALIVASAFGIRAIRSRGNSSADGDVNGAAGGELLSENSTAAEPEVLSCKLAAVGDNLMHNTVMKAAKTADGYEFSPFYELIAGRISGFDIAVVNQEAPLGGPDYSPSGYPNFNSPQQVGRDLVEAGFNVINQANNHAMDRGAGAVYDTIDFWNGYKDQGVIMTGAYKDAEDREQLRIMTKNGISFGFLSYTYGTNGIPLPKSNPDLVSLIDEDRIEYDMDRLSGECDVIVAIMHWGEEYTHTPNQTQRDLAKKLTELGADIIIGHHPHVLQPAEWIQADNGNRAFCIYSLGNFISSQNKPATMLGGLLTLEVTKTDGKTEIVDPMVTPLVTYFSKGWKTFKIYPIAEYTEQLAATHQLGEKLTPEYFKKLAREVLGEFADMPDEDLPDAA